MPRPNKSKRVCRMPAYQQFTSGGSRQTDSDMEIIMSVEEYETIRLIDYLGFTQESAAAQMEVGRATVQALYTDARRKLARYLVEGTRLNISGGNYEILPSKLMQSGDINGHLSKGDIIMKIAVTYENGQVFQHFGHTQQFKIYTIEEGKVSYSEIVDTNGSGHGALAGFLKSHEVSTLICGGIGGGARNALAEIEIELYAGAAGDADAQVESFLAGNLNYDPNTECNHHGHHHGGCGHHGEGHEGGCGQHGEGHEGGCGQHEEGHEGGCGHHSGRHEHGRGHHGEGREGGCGRHGEGHRGGCGRR